MQSIQPFSGEMILVATANACSGKHSCGTSHYGQIVHGSYRNEHRQQCERSEQCVCIIWNLKACQPAEYVLQPRTEAQGSQLSFA